MIKLNIEDRCQKCNMFEALEDKKIFRDGTGHVKSVTEITCKNKALCDRLIEFLKSQ